MNKKSIFLYLLLLLTGTRLLAQDSTLTYENQRQKVNNLLKQRSDRFGDFEESLRKKTGIFGFKTKKDMQASIDILKQIVLTDNHIFRETKTLIDYKDVQKSTMEEQASALSERVKGYMNTISKMQKERQQLHTALEATAQRSHLYFSLFLFSTLLIIVLSYLLFRMKKLTKN